MARDDYHVIVYQILSYLYAQLKKGKPINPEQISQDNRYFHIKEEYWLYIMKNLICDGLIDGITVTERRYIVDGESALFIGDLENCEITPRGIEFLITNSFMDKAKEFFLKAARDRIPPFVAETL